MTGLSDEDREAMAEALGNHWFKVSVHGPNRREVGCICGWQQPEDNHNLKRHNEHLADALAAIVQRAREAAWDQGYDMGDPYQRRGNPDEGKHRNPYRAADDAHGASQGPGGAEVGTC